MTSSSCIPVYLLLVLGCSRIAMAAVPAASTAESPAPHWQVGPGHRWLALQTGPSDRVGFTLLPGPSVGVAFTNALDESAGAANRVLYNGAGVAAGDVDGDGLPDLYFCQLSGANALYRNLGNWRFEDVTAAAGLARPLPESRGAVFADITGDGHPDLLVSVNRRGVLVFRNDGRGRFVDLTESAGTASKAGVTTLALADVDGNGTLDLYVTHYRPDDIRDRGRVNITMINGRPILRGGETNRFVMRDGRLEECGQPDLLLLNDGTGRFTAVPWTGGAFLDENGNPLSEPPTDWGLTATFRDINGDGAPDLYVCNDYWTPDRFWLNDGRGRFRAIEATALRKTPASSMSADFADIDRDGDLDFFAVDMLSRYPRLRKRQLLAQMPAATPVGVLDDRPQVMRNTLFLNRGDGTFAEVAYYSGMEASDWSWSPIFADVDLDGFEDLLIGAGHFRDVQDYDAEAQVQARQRSWNGFPTEAERQKAFTRELQEHYRLYPLLPMPIGAFRNLGDGRFREVTEAWGLTQPGIHQGLALADFDRDGDLDFAVNSLNGPAALYRHESGAGRVAVRLAGRAPNTQGIGAKVTLRGGAVPRQSTEVIAGGRYQSGSDPVVSFATGTARDGMTLEVRWRSGALSVVPSVEANRLYVIEEGVGAPAKPGSNADPEPAPSIWFEDASARLGHRHAETEFDDYQRQPLLPFKLSQLGPAVAWFDFDGDGHEDLVVGAGRGGTPAFLRSDGRGRFEAATTEPSGPIPDDTTGLVGWTDGAGGRSILMGFGGYEETLTHSVAVVPVGAKGPGPRTPIAAGMATAGALALGDMNGDGRLVLFVAGGVLPGQYPLGAPSRLYRAEAGSWALDVRNSGLLANLGIVNGAVWSDLDDDGFPELVLACEWGPVRVFRGKGGALKEVTGELGLSTHTGWWRGVTAGDWNGDGRMDLAVSNWGWNSPYRASSDRPLTFFYGQVAQPGVTEIIETEYVGDTLAPRRQFRTLANSMPFLMERFATHKAYSEASLEQVLGDRVVLGRYVAVRTLATTLFLNTDKGFEAVPLPKEAQFAPAFGINVADFDGDGNEDLFLAQNSFSPHPEATRIDAGLGLCLRGDGRGGFEPLEPRQSGIRVHGEQRGSAVADFDGDGRVDLLVTQNGAATRLFRNRGANPGLRVRLRGGPGNPAALGAVVRLDFGGRLGPARGIHGGSGYWSQDAGTLVMATPAKPTGIRVRWPGGRVTTTAIPEGLREVVVGADGTIAAGPSR